MKRAIGILVIIAVLGGLVYSQAQIQQMRTQMNAISDKLHLSASAKSAKSGGTDLASALGNAENHTKRAKELLRKNKNKEAQIELDKALKSLKSANNVSNDIVGDVAGSLGVAKERLIAAFQDAQKAISEQAQPKKIDIK